MTLFAVVSLFSNNTTDLPGVVSPGGRGSFLKDADLIDCPRDVLTGKRLSNFSFLCLLLSIWAVLTSPGKMTR